MATLPSAVHSHLLLECQPEQLNKTQVALTVPLPELAGRGV